MKTRCKNRDDEHFKRFISGDYCCLGSWSDLKCARQVAFTLAFHSWPLSRI